MSTAPVAIPGVPNRVVARLPARVVEHLRSPLYRNGYALVVATGATSLLGFLYWLLAARRYSPADVGRNSALLASMTFLANLAHLNLTNGLNRFVPTSGPRTPRLVGWSYAVAGGLAVVAALIYVGGIETWSPELTNLVRDNPLAVLAFVAATALWVVFQLEDSVLTGLGRADWVLRRERDLRRGEDRPAGRARPRAAEDGHLRVVDPAAGADRRPDQCPRVPAALPAPRRRPSGRRRADPSP